MSKLEKTLWDLAIDQAVENEDDLKSEENSILVVGSKGAGKTSIILRFLDRDEPAKPTTALEYTFGRKARQNKLAKDVGHIWELGGGTWLSKLIDVPISPDTLRSTSVMLVLDLSKPEEMWFTMDRLLTYLKNRIETAITEAKASDPYIQEDLRKAAWARVGEDHPEKDMIEPFLLPLVIIGAKYDLFQEFESEKRKVMCKTLRFVAHSHGATLQFFSVRQEALMTKARQIISHLVFKTSASKQAQLEHSKPLLVPVGSDSLNQIGSPPLPDGDIGKITARTPMELWKQAFVAYFPQENVSDPALIEDPAKDAQFKESAVDEMRTRKDEELERYRKITARKNRSEKDYRSGRT